MFVKIDPSVTKEQRRDPRFQKLLADTEIFFDSPDSNHYKLLLGLHEGSHAYFARQAGAINIRFYGPTMYFDSRPQYGCPAISRSSCEWTPNGGSILSNIKAFLAGYIARRELSDSPNDHIAVGMDLQNCRDWFDRHVGTGDDAFKQVVADAEREILEDLKSQIVVGEMWAEAKRFVKEVFEPITPAPKTKRIKIGRNEPCICGSGRKFKRCCIDRLSPEPLTA